MELKIIRIAGIGLAALVLAGAAYLAADEVVGRGAPSQHELETAAQGYASCGSVHGYSPTIVPGEGNRPPIVSFGIAEPNGSPSESTVREAEQILDGCREDYFDPVDGARAASLSEPTADELQAMYRRLQACVEAGGVPRQLVPRAMIYGLYKASPPLDFSITPEDKLAYKQCAMAEQAVSGLLAPPAD